MTALSPLPPVSVHPAPGAATLETPVTAADDRAVARWLMASCVAVVAALVIGGITRLTESGLAITEWKPVSGVIPPLTDGDWSRAYEQYLRIPEAQTVHRGITLAAFKGLYWWEWVHRILARMVGLVIAVPFFVLLLRRRIRPELQLRLANLPILVAAQGVLGWYMVKSGLTGRTDVSQYRLVAHLGVALLIYMVAAWTAMGLRRDARTGPPGRAVDPAAIAIAALAVLTMLSGGFVAGLDAGRLYNSFPLMGDGLVPREYWAFSPAWRNWFENPAAAQFNHRVLAIGTLVIAAGAWWRRSTVSAPSSRRTAWNVVAAAVVVQVALGIATLLLVVPIPVAALHQVGAVILLTAAMAAARHP